MPRMQASSWLSKLNPAEQALLRLFWKNLFDSMSLCCEIDTRQTHFLLLLTCYRDTAQRYVSPTFFSKALARVFMSSTSQHYQLHKAQGFSLRIENKLRKREKWRGQVGTPDSYVLSSAQLCRRTATHVLRASKETWRKGLHDGIKPEQSHIIAGF